MKKMFLALTAAFAIPVSLLAISAEDIVIKLEKNTVIKTARTDGSLIIHNRFGTKKQPSSPIHGVQIPCLSSLPV